MKRVLITGANSFLGDNTKKYLEKHGNYVVDILDMLNDDWREADFSQYDVVFNVCAIVHQPKIKDIDLYYKVNRDLAVEIATKAKKEGVSQFIQTSTNGVFGVEIGPMSDENGYKPKTPYEKSKYEADCLLEKLRSNSFLVCIVRPPIMYGNGCKGNFPKLEHFALSFPFFPSRNNKRDMIFIENMCDFILFAIEHELNETCYPRDNEPISVPIMIKEIAKRNNKKMHLLSILNPFVALVYKFSHKTRSIFGNNYCIMPISVSNNTWEAPLSFEAALTKMYNKD